MAEKSFNIKKLTNRAHKVLEIALWRALASDRTSISSEHLLAGLLEEGAGIAMHILGSLGVDVTNLKSDLGEFVASAEPDHLTPHKLPLASDLETVLRLSAEEAQRMGLDFVGTEHLLIGLLRSSEGLGFELLARHGLVAEKVRNRLQELMVGQEQTATDDTPDAPEPEATGLEGFTSKALEAVAQAHREADGAGRKHVGTDHLMLGLLSDGECAAVRTLERFDVDVSALVKALRKLSKL